MRDPPMLGLGLVSGSCWFLKEMITKAPFYSKNNCLDPTNPFSRHRFVGEVKESRAGFCRKGGREADQPSLEGRRPATLRVEERTES